MKLCHGPNGYEILYESYNGKVVFYEPMRSW